MLTDVAFVTGLTVVLAIAGLSTLKYLIEGFEFWPPPRPRSWQHRTLRALFRVFFLALIVLSITEFNYGTSPWRLVVGGALFLTGFGLALRWTGYLGWRNAFGDARGIKTEGPYYWSRNPIYVVSIIGMMGWALAISSNYLTILLSLWAASYLGAPFLEEPWLENKYGDEFRSYKETVPRFIGFRKEKGG